MKYSFRREDGTFLCNDGAWADDADDALIVDTDWPDVLADEMGPMVYTILSPYLNGERVIYILVEDTRVDGADYYKTLNLYNRLKTMEQEIKGVYIQISNQTKQEWVGLNSDIEQERLSGEAPMINLDDIPSQESENMVDSE